MLSRSLVIHRTPGESPRPAPVRPAGEPPVGGSLSRGRVWGKAAALVVLAALLTSFLMLNANGVVEPRVRLLFLDYQRPGLLPVLLLTSVLSIGCYVAIGAVFGARRGR